MKVKIIQCTVSGNCWYKNKIGAIYEIENNQDPASIFTGISIIKGTHGRYGIQNHDYKILSKNMVDTISLLQSYPYKVKNEN